MLTCLFSIQVDQVPSSSPLRCIQRTNLLIFLSVGCFPNLDSVISLFSSVSSLLFQGWHQDWAQCLHSSHIGAVYRVTPVELLGLWSRSPLQPHSGEIMFAQHLCMTGHLVLKVQPVLFELTCSSLYVKMLIISDTFELGLVPLHFSQSRGLFPPQN